MLLRSSVLPPPVQLNVYADTPPLTVRLTAPSLPPLHDVFVPLMVVVNRAGCVMVTVVVAVHAFESVTVIVYAAAGNADMSSVVALFDQL